MFVSRVRKSSSGLKMSNSISSGVPQRFSKTNIVNLCNNLGRNTFLPDSRRNYTIFNEPLVNEIISYREAGLPYLYNYLGQVQSEPQICEALYTLDKMIDNKVRGIENSYPIVSRFNYTDSPNIQVFLSGIYRKTMPPDAFGPLCNMLVKNIFYPKPVSFDPNEEIGGAIWEYIRSKNAKDVYDKKK